LITAFRPTDAFVRERSYDLPAVTLGNGLELTHLVFSGLRASGNAGVDGDAHRVREDAWERFPVLSCTFLYFPVLSCTFLYFTVAHSPYQNQFYVWIFRSKIGFEIVTEFGLLWLLWFQ